MIRTAVVGAGAAGASHIKEVAALSDTFDLVAIADIRADRAEEVAAAHGVPTVYTDYRRMFAEEQLDAVSVITSSDRHCEVVLEAARHGLHVLCEKPIANAVDQGWQMVRAMQEADRILAVTYTYRFIPDTVKLKTIIDSGVIGDLLEVRYYRLGGGVLHAFDKPPEGTEDRRRLDTIYTKEFGMNYDCGVHAMDLFRWYSGSDVKRITAQGIRRLGYDYADSATAAFEMDNGVRCIYDYGATPHMTDHGGHVFMIILTGRDGAAIWRFCGKENVDGKWGNTTIDVYSANGAEHLEFAPYSKNRDVQHRQFAEAVRSGTLEGTNFPQPADAVRATEVGLQLLEAIRENTVPVTR